MRLALSRAKRREIVMPDKNSCRLRHGISIKSVIDPPYPIALENRRRAAAQDAIDVVAFGGAEARVEAGLSDSALEHGMRARLQMKIDRFLNAKRIPVFRQIEMGHLTQGVHARVRSPCAPDADALARELHDRILKRALHRNALRLLLPADKRRSVVFDEEAVARHGSGGSNRKSRGAGLIP